MKNEVTMSPRQARKFLKKFDAQWAAIDVDIELAQQQRKAVENLRAICAPYMKENPQMTVGEVLELLRQSGQGAAPFQCGVGREV